MAVNVPCFWTPAQIIKKDGEVCWTHKAFNGRVILEFLNWCLVDFHAQTAGVRSQRFNLTFKAMSHVSTTQPKTLPIGSRTSSGLPWPGSWA